MAAPNSRLQATLKPIIAQDAISRRDPSKANVYCIAVTPPTFRKGTSIKDGMQNIGLKNDMASLLAGWDINFIRIRTTREILIHTFLSRHIVYPTSLSAEFFFIAGGVISLKAVRSFAEMMEFHASWFFCTLMPEYPKEAIWWVLRFLPRQRRSSMLAIIECCWR
jgi:hypothetical protein